MDFSLYTNCTIKYYSDLLSFLFTETIYFLLRINHNGETPLSTSTPSWHVHGFYASCNRYCRREETLPGSGRTAWTHRQPPSALSPQPKVHCIQRSSKYQLSLNILTRRGTNRSNSDTGSRWPSPALLACPLAQARRAQRHAGTRKALAPAGCLGY